MTALALQARMGAGQWELRVVMVKGDMVPAGRVVADRAILAVLALMRILLLMAGVAVCGRPFEYLVNMTGVAGDSLVLPFQLEGCQVVIELGRCPAVLVMAVRTFGAKAASMRINLLVTGSTLLRCDREIAQAAGTGMALVT